MKDDRKGILVVSMDVDEAMEDEFNRWFDTEHVSERLEVTGIVSARRFRAEEDSPRYLVIYEPEDVAAVESEAYHRLLGDKRSDWTKRMMPFLRNRSRGVYAQIFAASQRQD